MKNAQLAAQPSLKKPSFQLATVPAEMDAPFAGFSKNKFLKTLPIWAISSLLIVIFGAFVDAKTPARTSGEMVFHLTGLTPNRGWARVVLYNSPDKYLSQFGFCAADSAQVGADGAVDITLHNLPFGNYAGSFYQDENWNHVIDRNFAGLPTEPYGFSNSVRAKWSVPSFQSVSFDFEKLVAEQRVRLAYWSKQ